MQIRNRLHRRFLLTGNEFDWAEYEISRNSVKKALIEAEKHHTYQEVQNNMNKTLRERIFGRDRTSSMQTCLEPNCNIVHKWLQSGK